ncbi:hypothetical protein [Sphingobacterium detergens]|uniref:Antitoxin Xre/MbcA/ParS-like toxin-binding domain-containing protein n=1 Tax=Sphingobacterium detergens TaxID=1145106 RepID=A0A420BH75_SPHD1|nr:hypothetical protein [Sphingobacterium detergens]RKE56062.1 hypothetical protein DFQ12_0914 [Sphingobacterium detergens]
MIKLEQYYPGDEEWTAFSTLYRSMPQLAVLTELKNRFLDESLVYVIVGIVGDAALAWAERKIPALDHLRPVDCVGNTGLERRLKTMLMRMG